MNEIRFGDCREIMKTLIAEGVKVQTCVTSPPYYGLRDYGVEGQLGLEPTPGDYVACLVEAFRLVRDLLADDGTLWLNLGDSYAGDGGQSPQSGNLFKGRRRQRENICLSLRGKGNGLKPKDLIGIPWRVAFALQAEGWYLRSDIIWAKPNPMPESVTDRPTKSHEYLFLFSKSAEYFYDAEAIKTDSPRAGEICGTGPSSLSGGSAQGLGVKPSGNAKEGRFVVSPERANKRTVWTVPSQPYDGAHFATFPPDLILPCVLAGSRPHDIVFDPFMGSGTTAFVAKENGRRYLGCELNPEYKALQDERLAQGVLFGGVR